MDCCVELAPTLDHCIEATAREEYWSSVGRYLEGGHGDKTLEAKIELLRAFLESADFRKLRSQSERYLIQGTSVAFTIWCKGDELTCEMLVKDSPPDISDKRQDHLAGHPGE